MADHMKPNEGETREEFMSRCTAVEGNDQESCAADWSAAQPAAEEAEKFASQFVDPGTGSGDGRGGFRP